MRITKDNIKQFEDALEKWVQDNPRLSFLVTDALEMGAGDETMVMLTPDELMGNQLICGGPAREHCFDEKVIEFLKDRGVKFVIVGLILDDFEETGLYLVVGGAVPIPFDDISFDASKWIKDVDGVMSSSDILSRMLDDRNGSWRNDGCNEPGWSTFESE